MSWCPRASRGLFFPRWGSLWSLAWRSGTLRLSRLRAAKTSVVLRELDSGLAEAVSTLIWAAPRLQSEVAELKIVSRDV